MKAKRGARRVRKWVRKGVPQRKSFHFAYLS